MFGRRSSLNADTFTPPTAEEIASFEEKSPVKATIGKLLSIQKSPSVAEDGSSSDVVPESAMRTNFPPALVLDFARKRLLRQSRRRDNPRGLPGRTARVKSFAGSVNITKTSQLATLSPTPSNVSGRKTPQTPQELFAPPDPSSLSISGINRRGSLPFNQSTNSNASFPPATPTASREHNAFFGHSAHGIPPIAGLTKNDVDTSLKARFNNVTLYGNGEFSEVYRVEQPTASWLTTTPRPNSVWAVKKTKKPYVGTHDREKKLREVQILEALRGHEHIISISDSWEDKGHLYIQTEFCENGNLKSFLEQVGFDSRLDDFRIWKILLELSQVRLFLKLNMEMV